ncbi:MAG: AraC family transcriptional regulator [Pseudomonadota bacterium]
MQSSREDLAWLEVHAEVGDLTLAILPPGDIDVSMCTDMTLLDFNLAPTLAKVAMASDKQTDLFFPEESMAIYYSDVEFSVRAKNEMPGLLVGVGDDTLNNWLAHMEIDALPEQFAYKADPVGSKIAQAAIAELFQTGPDLFGSSLLTIEAIILALSTRFVERVQADSCGTNTPAAAESSREILTDMQIRRAQDYIMDNLSDPKLSITNVAREAGLSSSYFGQYFKNKIGITPYNYILRARLKRAKQLVSGSNLTLAEVAFRCGFSDQAHMTSTFSRRLGATPGQLRKSAGAPTPAIHLP